jgi:hypothetical protein
MPPPGTRALEIIERGVIVLERIRFLTEFILPDWYFSLPMKDPVPGNELQGCRIRIAHVQRKMVIGCYTNVMLNDHFPRVGHGFGSIPRFSPGSYPL